MHCVRSVHAIAIALVVRRMWRQSACAQPSLQAGYRISAGCVRLAVSTLFVSLFTFEMVNNRILKENLVRNPKLKTIYIFMMYLLHLKSLLLISNHSTLPPKLFNTIKFLINY
jgi:hypothetical protein